MSSRLAFWTFAWVNLSAILGCALVGYRLARARRLAEHELWMRRASWLAVVFLGAYVAKVFLLGREDLTAWSAGAIAVLRLHEVVVFTMLIAGGAARWLAFRHGRAVPPWHPRLGRIAVWAGVGALATGTAILVGMYARA